MNFLNRIGIAKSSVIILLLYYIIGISVKVAGHENQVDNLFTVSSFMFGIFVAFAISNANSRLTKISETLKADESLLLNLYFISGILGLKVKNNVQKLIDDYLINQLDYYLVDYKNTNQSFFKLNQYVINEIHLTPDNKKEETAYSNMLSSLTKSLENRKQVELSIQQPMLKLEWACIIALLSIVLFCAFIMNTQSAVSLVASILLATAATIFTFILRDLDSLHWKEGAWVWQDTTRLFEELDLLPYFPKAIYKSGIIKLPKGKMVRVATYPNKYPNFEGKKIDILET